MTPLPSAVEQAQALVDFARYDQARALLSQHLAEDPGDTRAWIEIGYCHLKMQQPEQALEAADEALKLAPEDFYVLILRAKALTSGPNSSWRAAEPVLREAVRADPQHWYGYTMLADAVCRMSMVRYLQENGSRKPEPHEVDLVYREAADLAAEALRLGPEEIYAHEIAHQIATFSGNTAAGEQLDRAILRLDPTHAEALARQTRKAAEAPGVKAGRAADLYATGLAAAPASTELQRGLDQATYRMLRGVRWLALLCVGLAGAGTGPVRRRERGAAGVAAATWPAPVGPRADDRHLDRRRPAAVSAAARRRQAQRPVTDTPPPVGPHRAGPGGLGHAVRRADHATPVGRADVAPGAVLGRTRTDIRHDLVRPEQGPLKLWHADHKIHCCLPPSYGDAGREPSAHDAGHAWKA